MIESISIPWRFISALCFLLGLFFITPMAVGIFDMFYWFWTNHTWSGIEYGTSGRPLVMLFFCVPALALFTLGSIIWGAVEENDKMKKIQENIDRSRNG